MHFHKLTGQGGLQVRYSFAQQRAPNTHLRCSKCSLPLHCVRIIHTFREFVHAFNYIANAHIIKPLWEIASHGIRLQRQQL